MRNRKLRWTPALTLLVLAPLLGELVSGHQAPDEFFNPITFLVMSLPYGCGALLCREVAVRRESGWIGLVLMAVAFALYEEALVARSVFNNEWHELDASMVAYGYRAGVHWTYTAMLVHFHVTISIASSVILAGVLHPAHRDEPWLGPWGFGACAAVLGTWLPVLWLLNDYRPPLLHTTIALGVIVALVACAVVLRAPRAREAGTRAPVPAYFLLGAANMWAFFFGVILSAEHGVPALWITLASLGALDALTLGALERWSGGFAWRDRERVALVAGWLSFFIVLAASQDAEEGFRGRSIVSAIAAMLLLLLYRRIRRR